MPSSLVQYRSHLLSRLVRRRSSKSGHINLSFTGILVPLITGKGKFPRNREVMNE